MSKELINSSFDIKGGHKIVTPDLNHLRVLVEEIRECANDSGRDLSNALGDFCFSVEAEYQSVHELDQDNWEIVHE